MLNLFKMAEEQQPTSQPDAVSSPKEPFLKRFIVFLTSSFSGFLVIVAVVALMLFIFGRKGGSISIPGFPSRPTKSTERVEAFSSEEEFKEYLSQAEELIRSGFGGAMVNMQTREMQAFEEAGDLAAPLALEGAPSSVGTTPSRVSETNVQVRGIDEPDILKTDGQSIFFSSNLFFARPLQLDAPSFIEPDVFTEEESILPPEPVRNQATKVIDAFPPADLEVISGIDKQGEMLLADDMLVVFSNNDVFGYDVSSPESPKQQWTIDLDSRTQIVSSRLFNDTVYLVTQTRINSLDPCPIPLRSGGQELFIACDEIFHPVRPIPADSTFTVLAFDPSTGDVEARQSFVGTSGQSVVYMSLHGIYITYNFFESPLNFFYDFLVTEGSGLLPKILIDKLGSLRSLEISAEAKMVELQKLMEEYDASLDSDDRLKLQNEMENRMERYMQKRLRDFQQTGIVRIDVPDLNIRAAGSVPGMPLNQFSLDEYRGNLRIATTVNDSMFGTGTESANDVYVLDSTLSVIGQVQGLGLTERIYSARFIGDRGYLVTFRRIDPFYVLDLSDARKPVMRGELKIPGFSSYLHPIYEDVILGVGEEGNKVKLSLFDVGDAENPTESSKYQLDEYWTDVANTHHAFLMDAKHMVFFIPGSQGGYVFSYAGDELELLRAVSDISARRALFIDDYLYIVGDDKIVVLNENDWTEVNRLVF